MESRKHLAAQLRARASVKLDEPFLRKLKGTEASPGQLDHVIARVGKTAIRYREVHEMVRSIAATSGHMAGGEVKIALAWQVVDSRLLEESAVQRGMLESPSLKALEPEIDRAVAAAVTAERIQARVPAPSEKEVEDFYRARASAYGARLRDVRARVAADAAAEKRASALSREIAALRGGASILTRLAPGGLGSGSAEGQ